MTLTLQQIITAARDADSAFAKQRVPDAVFARYLSRYQRQLVGRAHEIRPGIVSSQISIVMSPAGLAIESPLGTIGAASPAGLPVVPMANQVPGGNPLTQVTEQVVGNTVELDLTDAPVLWPKTVVASATTTTITVANVNWPVNQWVGQLLVITDGTDVFDRRYIASNTATTVTVSAPFAATPDTTSLFMVVQPMPVVTQETGAAIALPALGQRYSYLVKYDANGNPYLDLTNPLIGYFEQGIPLPPHKALLDGVIYFNTNVNPYDVMPLSIVDRANRTNAWGNYCAWTDNTNLYLIGRQADWESVASIDLRYVPEPIDLAALTDPFVLPDSCEATLVAAAAAYAAERVYNAPDTPEVDVERYQTLRGQAEQCWFDELGSRFRAEQSYTVEKW